MNCYLRLEGNTFGFIIEDINEIKETDIKITTDDYNRFFELQSKGRQFRIKDNAAGAELFDYIEEYIQDIVVDTTPSTEDRLKALEMALLEVL